MIGHNKGGGVKLDYSLWWRELGAAVGRENVLFLPFERLREDRASFLRPWLDFLGVPEADSIVDALAESGGTDHNVRSRAEDTWTLRTPIKKGRSLLRWPDFSRGSEIRLTEALREEILTVYAEGNRSLDEEVVHLNLDEHGYY